MLMWVDHLRNISVLFLDSILDALLMEWIGERKTL